MTNLIDKINNILENSSEQRSLNRKYRVSLYQQNLLKYCHPWHTTISPPHQKEIIAKFSYCSKFVPREINPIIIKRWPDGPCTKTPKTTNVELASTIHNKHAKISQPIDIKVKFPSLIHI